MSLGASALGTTTLAGGSAAMLHPTAAAASGASVTLTAPTRVVNVPAQETSDERIMRLTEEAYLASVIALGIGAGDIAAGHPGAVAGGVGAAYFAYRRVKRP